MADLDNDPFAKYVQPAAPAADPAAPAADADPFARYAAPGYQAPRGAMQQVLPRAGDLGISLAKGLIGVPETFLGLGDMVSGGGAGKLAEQAGFHAKQWKQALDEHYSPEGQEANRQVAEAKGFVPTIAAMLRNPSTIANQAVESAPTIVSGGVVARGMMKLAPALATAEGAIGAGAIGEGATAAGQNAEQVRQEDPNGTLTAGQSAILAASGALTGAIGMGAGRLANQLGIGDAATMAASGHLGPVGEQAIATGASKGMLRKIGEGALVEGIGQELPQSYQEQVAQNLAQGKPWDEGAAAAGAQGMLAGGLMGAVAGPLHGHQEAHTPAAEQAPPATPAGPLEEAAALVAPGRQLFAFGDMNLAQKQADSFTTATGIPHQAVPHPSVAGRFAAVPVSVDGADPQFVKEAERQGVDPAAFQLATAGDGAAALMSELLAAHPDVTAQQWSDPATRAQLAAAYLKQQNDTLGEALGRAPTPAETWIARQLGAGPAAELLNVPASEQALTPVEAFIPDQAVAARLGVAGMAVDGALDTLTARADGLLASMKENGNANLGTAVPATGSGSAGADGGAAVGKPAGSGPVAGGPAGGTGTVAAGTTTAPGAAASGPDGAGAVAPAPRVQVGPTADGYQNVNAQRHRDTADALGLTDTIERLFGDGLTVNQVVGQIADKAPGVLPADLPNLVNGVRGSLGIPAPISPEGKAAFDNWRADFKARGQTVAAAPAAQGEANGFPDVPDFPAGPTNVGAAKVTPESVRPKNAFDEAAHQSSNSPLNDRAAASSAQIDADNYKLGRTTLFDMPVGIENPKGSTRRSKAKDSAHPWESLMTAHYGRFTGTVGADGDPVDVFVGDHPDSGKAFIVDQVNPKTGKFDEHKVIAGVNSEAEARQLYQDNYHAGWTGAKAITEVTPDQLRYWLQHGDMQQEFAAAPTPASPSTNLSEATPTGPTTSAESDEEAPPRIPGAQELRERVKNYTKLGKDDDGNQLYRSFNDAGEKNLVIGKDGELVSDKAITHNFDLDGQRSVQVVYDGITGKYTATEYDAAGKPGKSAVVKRDADDFPATIASTFGATEARQIDRLIARTPARAWATHPEARKQPGFNLRDFESDVVRYDSGIVGVRGNPATLPAHKALGQKLADPANYMTPPDKLGETISQLDGEIVQAKKRIDELLAKQKDAEKIGDGWTFVTSLEVAHRMLGSLTETRDSLGKAQQATTTTAPTGEAAPVPVATTTTGTTTPEAPATGDGDAWQRASAVYQDMLNAITADPSLMAHTAPGLMREQMTDGVKAPRDVAEDQNSLGLKVGDVVYRGSDKPYRVLSIKNRMQGDKQITEVKSITPGSYGGWAPIEHYSLQPAGGTAEGDGKSAQATVNYPNRQLGFQKAASDEDARYDDHAWANIAAANMKVGDSFELGGKSATVASISDKTLKLVIAEKSGTDRTTRTLNPDGVAWPQFQRDLGGQLAVENLQANNILKPARPLLDILKRDPAVHVDAKGSVYLKDGGPVVVAQAKDDAKDDAKDAAKPPRQLSDYQRREQARAIEWGFTAGNMPAHGVMPNVETALSYDNNKSRASEKHLSFSVKVAQGPNGKWAMASSHATGTTGQSGPVNLMADMHDSRADALAAGVAELRQKLRVQDMAALNRSVAAVAGQDGAKAGDLADGVTPDQDERIYGLAHATTRDGHGLGLGAAMKRAKAWGYTEANVPLYRTITNTWNVVNWFARSQSETVYEHDSKDGEPRLHFSLIIAQAPNGNWATGGQTLNSTGPAHFSSPQYASRAAAIAGGTAALKQAFAGEAGAGAVIDRVAAEAMTGTDAEKAPKTTEDAQKPASFDARARAILGTLGAIKTFDDVKTAEDALYALHEDMARAKDPLAPLVMAAWDKVRVFKMLNNGSTDKAFKRDAETVKGTLKAVARGIPPGSINGPTPAALAAAGPKPATPDNPLKFYSGMSRPGDFTKLFTEHRNVGITVSELSAVSTPKIAEAMAASNGYLFVDSGAFPIYKRNERAFLKALSENAVEELKDEEVLSFDQILARYAAIQKAINEADDSGEAVERAFFVMPDVVGRQDESLRLVGQYARQIKAFGQHNAIVPLQAGELTLTQAYESMMLELAMDPNHDVSPIIGIPSAVEAVSNEQLTALLEKHGHNIMGLHILGAISDKRLAPRIAAIRAAGFDGHVSADANRLRALMYGERTRGQAWDALMAESTPEKGRIDTGATEAAPGKEVSRFAGKYGKGMSQANAQMAANNRAKADPAHDYSVEEAPRHGPAKYEVVGREKVAAPLPGLKQMQDAKAKNEAVPAPAVADPAGAPPLDRAGFIADMNRYSKVQFGEATFELAAGARNSWVVNASYPGHNTVIGVGAGEAIRSTPPLSRSEAIEQAASAAFDWWQNRRQKDAAFAERRARLVRAGQREIYGVAARLPDLVAAAALPLDQFTAKAEAAINGWVAGQLAAAGNDAERTLMLQNMAINGKTTLPAEFFKSLHKFAARTLKLEQLAAARDPALYKQALLDATIAAGLPADADQVALFMAGWDHALLGKTKSTLPQGELRAKGYEAAVAWRKSDAGAAWYTGKRASKLENTGAALRRWFDRASAKVRAVTADNLADSYEIIKAQASRADAFAGLAGEGATPGTTRYLNALRDNLLPFQQWLLEKGPLSDLGGAWFSHREGEGVKIAAYLDGRSHTYTRDPDLRAKTADKDASNADRLALLQDAASTYMGQLRQIAGAVEGATSVTGAAERFDSLMVADKTNSYYSDARYSEAGKQLRKLFRNGRNERYEAGTYQVRELTRNEMAADAPGSRKQALLVPKLDRVVREGATLPDYRKGKDITPEQMKQTFGFADVGFGNYVAAKQDQDHINYAYDAFMDLAHFLGVEPKFMGLGGTLHFSVGALGHGRHAAHFSYAQPHPDGRKVQVINVTNTSGDGTVAHEWLHALDHALNDGYQNVTKGEKTFQTWKQDRAIGAIVKLLSKKYDIESLSGKIDPYLTGDSFMHQRGRKTPSYDLSTDAGLIENATSAINWYAGMARATDYKRQADSMGEDYWGNPRELLARAFEAYVHDRLGGTSNYLVNPEWVEEGKITAPQYKGAPYPRGEERTLFNDAMAALVKALRFDAKGVSIERSVFEKEFPDLDADYKRAKQALIDDLPRRLELAKLAKRAAALAKENAKDAADKAKQDQAQAALAAQQEAERLRVQQELEQAALAPQAAPDGTLSDDELAGLFEQAENELAEQAQAPQDNAPTGTPTPAPGEALAAQADTWTQEDYRFLLDLVGREQIVLTASKVAGLATIHDIPGTDFVGFGTLRATTADYEVLFNGGGEMQHTPGGQGYTLVSVTRGRDAFLKQIKWADAKMGLQSRLIVKSGPKAAPTLAAEQAKTAAKLIAEAAKLGVKGIDEALKGFTKLFGAGPGKLQSFPGGMDEDTYRQAKPHFQAALKAFQDAGKTLVDLFKMLIQNFGSGIKPYALHFAKEQGLTASLAAPSSTTAKMAAWVRSKLIEGSFTSQQLFEMADDAFGGTQAAGVYTPKDAYDAMEAGVNRYIMGQQITPDGSATDARYKIDQLDKITEKLPTQTKRTPEMDEFQQFSTPPSFAFAAAWTANMVPADTMLEPSAGVGGIAMYAQLAGARVVLNELSARRAGVLAEVLPGARLFHENAEQLNNVLPADVKPSVIVMNPPFSSTAGRMQGARDTHAGALHIEQALKRLQPGGRLVAIVGNGMAADKPAFKKWWDQIKQEYTVRANIGVDGSNYAKYGTTFDNQLLVIDKTGPTTGAVITGRVDTVGQLPALLEGVRNDRQALAGPGTDGQQDAAEPGGGAVPGGATVGDGNGGADPAALGDGQRSGVPGERTGPAVPGTDGVAAGSDDALATSGGNRLPGQPAGPGRGAGAGGGTGGRGGRGGQPGGRGNGAAGTPVQRDRGDGAVNNGVNGVTMAATDTAPSTDAMTDAIFESYQPQRLTIDGAKPHPGKLVQSAAMGAVEPPAPAYTPSLPKSVITKGQLSLAQLEAVVYAGQAHAQMLPGDKERRGFFIGDGTGVGKGREIAGIILDNMRQGRKKAVWLSAKQGLVRDARRDFAGVSGDPDLITAQNKTRADGVIAPGNGILFTTYDTLASGWVPGNTGGDGSQTLTNRQLSLLYPAGTAATAVAGGPLQIVKWLKNDMVQVRRVSSGNVMTARFDQLVTVAGKSGWGHVDNLANKAAKGGKAAKPSRMDQLVNWLGKDFDGVIAFDEAHKMGNVFPKKGKRGTTQPSAMALAGVKLQALLPNARIVYVSATAATEVANLGYASRLGLWGEGSAFAKPADFIAAIESGGVAAMELVSRDMKAAGSYLARSLSFDGVSYERLEHTLTPLQTDIYNELAGAWQIVLRNVNEALAATGQGKVANAKSAALSAFWGGHQRFFNHIITSMQMPSIIERAQADLAAGNAVVMQLVNTNEAEQKRQVAKIAADDDATFEDLDFTPRESLLGYIRNGFPVAQYEEYTDDNGDKQMRPVTDAAGKPVANADMVAKRDALVKTLESIRVPDNPIDMIVNAFGHANVAEITGRSKRFVQEKNARGEFKVVEQKRPASAVTADADAFMDDQKRVLVFSDAGGTGYSFQSDLGVKNQRRRVHYLVQPGWRASPAVQGFGRTHRSNEANQPHYVLPSTNLKAQKRFISSIARRLDQLGALTKGQRETGGQGMFSAADNLESEYAADALHNLFMDMYRGASPLDFNATTEAMGLTGLIDDRTGTLNVSKLPGVPKFLNRLLSLTTTMQDTVFEQFFKGLEETIARAKERGDFDAGMETLRADKVEKVRDEVVYTDKRTDAKTRYIELELTHPTEFNSFERALLDARSYGDKFIGFYRNERSGRVFSQMETGTATLADGKVVTRGRRMMTTGMPRYSDDVDTVKAGANSRVTFKKKVEAQVYQRPASGMLSEPVEGQAPVQDSALENVIRELGMDAALVQMAKNVTPRGLAAVKLLERMKAHLVQKTVERVTNAYTALTDAEARAAWAAEQAALPATYTSNTHLLTGILLPIWDRLPGNPRVVRTQTVDGERLLGRVVSERDLTKTLKNLGVGSNLASLTPERLQERILNGERALLANGWTLQKVRVANDNRIEVSGADLGYSQSARALLVEQGAFVERINWADRIFVPTGGAQGAAVLGRIIASKPVVDMLGKDAKDDDAALSRAAAPATGMAKNAVQQVADGVRAGWASAPPLTVVQRVTDLPFAAPADTRGAYYQGRVWLVGENLSNAPEVQFVLAHEALGHAGLAAIMAPRQLANEMNRLRMINPQLAAAAREQAEKHGIDLTRATEEALAELAGSGATIKGWQKFVQLVQQVLRALGLDHVADWIERHTQAETMGLLRRARAAIEGRRAPSSFGAATAAAFSDGAATHWYSVLARQLGKTVTKSATPLHWAETIMSGSFTQQGVKQDEIAWSGVLDWLAMQQQAGVAKVKREQLLDYLAENGVRVTETQLGEPSAEDIDLLLADEAGEGMTRADALDYLRQDEGSTKYTQWQLPGGDNYRELLLTLPVRGRTERLAVHQARHDALDAEYRAIVARYEDEGGGHIDWAAMTPADTARLADLSSQLRESAATNADAGQATFQSAHWDERNVLAHIRFNDRVDADGARVLFVEEMQSDWGQKAKREGFAGLPASEQELQAARDATDAADRVLDGARSLWQKYDGDVTYWQGKLAKLRLDPRTREQDIAGASAALDARQDQRAAQLLVVNAASDALIEAGAALNALGNRDIGIAPAPFVGKTEAWLSLALKRVISYAAGHGYDKVAFVNGQQSAARYSLEKQVREIRVLRRDDDRYSVFATRIEDEDGEEARLTDRAGVDGQGLADFIGKELADKAVAALDAKHKKQQESIQMYRVVDEDGRDFEKSGRKYQLWQAQETARAFGLKIVPAGTIKKLSQPVEQVFSGLDLKVGGEGMKAFYDKIVPNVANDVLKKLGGGRLGTVEIANTMTRSVDDIGITSGGDGAYIHGTIDDTAAYWDGSGWSDMAEEARMYQSLDDARTAYAAVQAGRSLVQPGFAISDALREKAAGGLPLFAQAGDNNGEQRNRSEPGADVARLAALLGPQLYGDVAQMGPVTVKELFQNAFDALKGALEQGHLAAGAITITTDPSARTITISDNGTGMTPAIINKAFLTLAGTNKETARSSGGFGIAKMLFLLGNEELHLTTVRDGVQATLDTTGAQMIESFSNPAVAPDIVTRNSDAASGTTVTVKIPASFRDPSTGRTEDIGFPGEYEMKDVLANSPLFENITVTVNGSVAPIGSQFPKDDFTTFSTVHFDWGTARIIISKNETARSTWGRNVNVLSNGLWQFGYAIKEDPFGYSGDNIPRAIYINVEPRVKPEESGYPFALNRQSFAPGVQADFSKIDKYISVLYGSNKAAENAAGFGQVEYVNADNSVSDKLQLAPKLDAAARENMMQINEGDVIEIHDGRMTVNGRAVPELTPDDLERIKVDMSKFKIDQTTVDPSRPMIHDNLDVKQYGSDAEQAHVVALGEAAVQAKKLARTLHDTYSRAADVRDTVPYNDKERRDAAVEQASAAWDAYIKADRAYDAAQALHRETRDALQQQQPQRVPITQKMRARFGARFDAYAGDMGRLFMALRDAVVAEGGYYYQKMGDVPVGISFDKDYYGVHTMTPFRAMFLNPAISALDRNDPHGQPAKTKLVAAAMMGTMVHEIAHFAEMNHSTRFIGEMQRLIAVLESSDSFNLANLRGEVRSLLDKNHDIYLALNDTVNSEYVENRGVKLEDSGTHSARNERLADAVERAGQAGQDDGRVAGQAGAGADAAERRDFDAAVSRFDQGGRDLAAANAGPLFSRRPADLSARIGAVVKGLTVTSIKNKGVDWRGIGLQFLGRRQLSDLYGHLFPQGAKPDMMASYNTLAMKMDAEKNEAGAAADALATRWGKLPKPMGDALAELMHDATRLQIDPRKARAPGDIKQHYDELKAAHDALSADAKAIFDAAAAAYEAHYAAVKAAVHERVDRAMVGNPNKAAMLASMDANFFGKIKGIYFPLARFGDYLVQVNWRGANPNPAMGQAREAIHFAETMAEAQQLRKELIEKYPPSRGFQVAEITRRAEYNAARDAVGRGFLQQLFNVFKASGVDPSLQDAINQLYLTSLPDLSWAKHGIHRKGTPGFSQDARRAFANHMFHGARYLAKLHFGDQLAQDLDDMGHYIKAHAQDADYEPVKAQQLLDEMLKRHDLYMNPKSNPLSTTLTSLGFVFYLGLSPASAIVNLSQTAMVAYPILGGRYGFGKAASALIAASKDAVRGHNDMGTVLTGDELRAYQDWVKSGLVDVSMAHDLAGVAAGNDSMLHGAVGRAMKAASFMFHHAERFNRQATALASYRMARAQGMDHEAAYAASVEDTYASHFDYAAGNRPRVMQGDVARVLLLFKQYAQNMIYTFARNTALAFKGDRQALKTISGLLVSHALGAGVLGLPVVGLLLAAASMIGGSDDEPWDAEIALRNLLADAVGQKAGEVIAHGISRLTPWDISARVGLNSLLLPDVQEGLQGAPLAESYMTGLLGPVASMGVNAAKGMYTISHNGDWQRGLEEMVPAALRGPLKALRYAREGVKDRTGIELLPDTTALEDAGQVLGFSPSRGREAQEGKSAVYKTDKALQQRRASLMREYARQVMTQQDPSATIAEIGAFNALHPNRLIAPLHLQQSVRLRMAHVAQARDGIYLPGKRGDARSAGAFADETP